MLVELKGWGDITGDSIKALKKLQHPEAKGTTKITCKAFDFNFENARIKGDVVINIPNVGSIFCGAKGVTSDHSTYSKTSEVSNSDIVSTSTNIKTYDATRNGRGGWNLELVHVTPAVEREYQHWLNESEF